MQVADISAWNSITPEIQAVFHMSKRDDGFHHVTGLYSEVTNPNYKELSTTGYDEHIATTLVRHLIEIFEYTGNDYSHIFDPEYWTEYLSGTLLEIMKDSPYIKNFNLLSNAELDYIDTILYLDSDNYTEIQEDFLKLGMGFSVSSI